MKQVLYKKIFHFYDRDFILTLEFIGYKENPILLYGHLTPWRTVWSLAVGVHICASLPLCIIHSAVADKRISKWNFYLCGNLFTKRPAKQKKKITPLALSSTQTRSTQNRIGRMGYEHHGPYFTFIFIFMTNYFSSLEKCRHLSKKWQLGSLPEVYLSHKHSSCGLLAEDVENYLLPIHQDLVSLPNTRLNQMNPYTSPQQPSSSERNGLYIGKIWLSLIKTS